MRFGEFISEEIIRGSKEVEIRVITDEERKWWGSEWGVLNEVQEWVC